MTGSIDLNPNHLATVERILAEHVPECEVRAFGSRATWTAKDYSDIDLAIVGEGLLEWRTLGRLKEAFEESSLPMRVDVLDWHDISDSFQKVIERDYVVLQKRAKKKVRLAGSTSFGSMSATATLSVASQWREVVVSDVASATIGGTPSRAIEGYWQGNVPWATAKDVAGAGSRYLNEVGESITELGLTKSAAKLMPEGTVIITARGTVGALAQLGEKWRSIKLAMPLFPQARLITISCTTY